MTCMHDYINMNIIRKPNGDEIMIQRCSVCKQTNYLPKNDLLVRDINKVIESLTKLGETALYNEEPVLSSIIGRNVCKLNETVKLIRRTD